MPILEVEHISKSFNKTPVLKDVGFNLEKGQAVSIIGSSGSVIIHHFSKPGAKVMTYSIILPSRFIKTYICVRSSFCTNILYRGAHSVPFTYAPSKVQPS